MIDAATLAIPLRLRPLAGRAITAGAARVDPADPDRMRLLWEVAP